MNNKTQTLKPLQTEKLLREATNELGDYFSRLGGSARYLGMEETDIPLFICFLLAELGGLDLNSFEYHWVQTFKQHGEGSVAKTREKLASITWTKDKATEVIKSYIVQINELPRKMTLNKGGVDSKKVSVSSDLFLSNPTLHDFFQLSTKHPTF